MIPAKLTLQIQEVPRKVPIKQSDPMLRRIAKDLLRLQNNTFLAGLV